MNSKWILLLTVITLIISISSKTLAIEMAPEEYLVKISQRLTGVDPIPDDYDKLESKMSVTGCRRIACLNDFFQTYVRTKLNSPAFLSQAVLKVHERLSFQTPRSLPFPLQPADNDSENLQRESLLVYRTMTRNLPLDELFTSQYIWQVKSPPDAEQLGLNPDAYYGTEIESEKAPASFAIKENNPALGGQELKAYNYVGHPNVSGLFTGKKFLDRYWNTPVNGNRKRAAAIFKIMLCDPMSPALERKGMLERENNLATGKSEVNSTLRTIEEIHKNRHGKQKDCAACHDRLDPLARTLRPLEISISKFPAKGRLRFYDEINRPVDYPAENFHDIITQITKQQKYADCQMNWLFNWIVGKDVSVHPQRYAEMLNDFEQNQHRLRETIERLVMSPEFRGEVFRYPTPPSYQAAANVLSNCSECHGRFLNTRGSGLKSILAKIAFKLDLSHDGVNRVMPPSYHYWEPTAEDLRAVKNWIAEGAPMVTGSPLLEENEVRTLLDPAQPRPEVPKKKFKKGKG